MNVHKIESFIIVLMLGIAGSSCSSISATQPPVAASTLPGPTSTPQPSITLQPCMLGEIAAQCGVLSVHENRATNMGRKVDIHVAMIKAQSPNPAPDPIFYVAGGPGASGLNDATYAMLVLKSATQRRDLVLFDQRGTGQSNQLVCPRVPEESGGMVPIDEQMLQDLRTCLTHLDGDPGAYTTAWGMDDLDDVRAALGYDQINLYGESYGTNAEQVYLQRHPEHVRTMALEGVSLLDVPMFERMPRNSQRALDFLFARCHADPACNSAYPELSSELAALIAQLENQPVELPVTNPNTGQRVKYNRDALVLGVHQMLLLTPTAVQLPYVIHQVYLGDWSFVVQGVTSDSFTAQWNIMNLTILCHEDWAKTRREETDRFSAGSYLNYEDVRRFLAPDPVCALMPRPQPEALYQPVTTFPVPVLILSNEVDPQNPPGNVAHAKESYPNSLTLVAPGQGHGYTGFACRDQILVDFIEKGTTQGLNADCLQQEPLPAFVIQ